MRNSSDLFDPARVKNIQDTLYAALFCGVTLAFMLFLLGSADVMTSLSIIGILLCLSLVGSVLRFLALSRQDRELRAAQTTLDRDFGTLQHRVNDHDLLLLDMNGKLEALGIEVVKLKTDQTEQARTQHDFMRDLKGRFIQLATRLSKPRETAKRRPLTQAMAAMPAATANDAPKSMLSPETTIDDDIVVSPSLVREALATALAQERVDLYLQPIATLPNRQVHGYDVSGRIRLKAGVYIPVRDFRAQAAHAGQLATLDRLVLRELTRETDFALPVFVNLGADTLTDRAAMVQLAQLLRTHPGSAKNLVLCLTQHDFNRLNPAQESVIRNMTQYGVKWALNDMTGPDLDLNHLAQLGVAYLKMPYARLFGAQDNPESMALTQRFMTRLQTRNIQLIVGQIETPQMVRKLLDYPVTLGQGYALARPDRPVAFTKKVA